MDFKYGAPIWNPYTKTDTDFIEHVQNRFLKFVAFKFNLTIDYHDSTHIRSFRNIPALFSTREIAAISFIYKLINGITDDPDLLNCLPLLFQLTITVPHHCFTFQYTAQTI